MGVRSVCKHRGKGRFLFRGGDANAHVIVSNTGPGIDPHQHENIFNPSYRPQESRPRRFGGIGIGLIEGGGPGENVAEALEADSLDDVADPVGRTFRAFADQTRSDRRALAACLRGSRRLMTREEAARIAVPVLIAVGTSDEIAGSAASLGKVIPGSQVLDIPNRDHMRAVGDKVYKSGVLDFLSQRK